MVPSVCKVPEEAVVALFFVEPTFGMTNKCVRVEFYSRCADHPDLAFDIGFFDNPSDACDLAFRIEEGDRNVTY
tara:strand:+ start:2174 stop:2395 length:222 start_codon:yes stop_codon:yes gene_type:complete